MYMAKSAREIRNPPATPPSERRRRYDKDVVGDDDDEIWMGGLDLLCSVGGSVSSGEEITPAELFLPASSYGSLFHQMSRSPESLERNQI